MTNTIEKMKESINEAAKSHDTYSHSWGDTDGSRCSKCGDKDWMADAKCSVSDEECALNNELAKGVIINDQ